MQKVDEVEEAYTGEEITEGALCYLPDVRWVVNVERVEGHLYLIYINNGHWNALYNIYTKQFKVRDAEADLLIKQGYCGEDVPIKTFSQTVPWEHAGPMLVIDKEVLSEECLSQWYIPRKKYKVNSIGNLEEVYRDCF